MNMSQANGSLDLIYAFDMSTLRTLKPKIAAKLNIIRTNLEKFVVKNLKRMFFLFYGCPLMRFLDFNFFFP